MNYLAGEHCVCERDFFINLYYYAVLGEVDHVIIVEEHSVDYGAQQGQLG